MKVALYARVSTAEQNAETQLAVLRRYCQAREWTVAEEYVDQISGVTASRPRLDQMMKDGATRKFEVVLVWKFDRLFRSVSHMLAALERFRGLGVDFVSVTEAIDTTGAVGKMVYTLLAAIAEFERDLIRERTRAGMSRARSEGKRIGRPRVAFDLEEAVRLWDGGEGLSYRAIGKKLHISASKIYSALQGAVLKRESALNEQAGEAVR
jgi:DNA invertase Pin-like site-specific DNA recombinase